MKFSKRKAISPIIATLLLIAIAVSAGIIVYVFVNGLSGSLTAGGGGQTAERLQMQSFTFAVTPPVSGGFTCGCSGQLLDIALVNSGGSSTTISAVYYDGSILPLLGAFAPAAAFPGAITAYTAPSPTYLVSGTANGDFGFSATGTMLTYSVGGTGQVVIAFPAGPTSGTSHTVKVVSSTGATSVFTVTAGRSG